MKANIWTIVLAAACGGVGCGGRAENTEKAQPDPNKPAVIQAPQVVLQSDTAHPDTMQAYREKVEQLRRQFSEWYAFSGAMAVMGDRRTLATFYTPDATVRIADTTFSGATQVVTGLVDLARRAGLKEFARMPGSLHLTDSTVVDSGIYAILSQREGGARHEERGLYVTTWTRQNSKEQPWIIRKDELRAAAASKQPSKAPAKPSKKPS